MDNKNIYRIVFYLWIPKDFNDGVSKIYKHHLKCLKKYSSIFTDAIFILSMDNIDDSLSINRVEMDIINCGFEGNIQFKIVENNPELREASTFYDEIIKKMGDLDGLTFFAHSKGMSNINNGTIEGRSVNEDMLLEWISAMYYLNLENIEDVKWTLLKNFWVFYGALLSSNYSFYKKTTWQYNGTFQWINTKKLNNYMKENNIFVPECTDRMYAEAAMGRVIPFDFTIIRSFKNYYIDTETWTFDMYNESDNVIRSVLPEGDDYNNFIDFHREIISSI